ncbi:MAG: hypothetical protein A2931_04235 [Candidatus Niyogibacteria bacterium RIFCSPLOWO2_01_FULL_45_48]|uniref:UDP-4-amino-4, 6-dideoxy-N-acetyl-beta-L-altrosamine transaminase n=2 Tax=Candidatus Niyogiibacteriota TaxID=1817912 RepID=A0A1G2EZY6_9BACT|nr:MAG: hypothetical protein A2931_04235 [Candidatus Niyogibacteria bacterium RIFCSPLOWO2_01_FULL_45_48]OGZ31404.1 MAG: hypothetical protein A3J00_02135 [Candidatus Niyogibacteria bacterium RIFCSPLOWO2_02_FULL_45_13]
MKVEFYRHNLTDQDKREVDAVIDSLFLTTGEWTKKFEEKLALYVGSKYAVGLASCTNALELALKYFCIGQGDEVITTPMSFVATANAIEYTGAKPVFVDVEKSTGNIDADLIERSITKNTKAILPVHLYGQICDMRKIRAIADKYNLKIIEDAAHCIEGTRDGVKVGELGDIACYSFYATKNITSGEGGATTCNDQNIYEWMLKARQHGLSTNAVNRYVKKYEHYDMEFLGMKCNMSNIQAALLINQVDRIDGLLTAKESAAEKFNEGFKNNSHIGLPSVLKNSKHARHVYTIWVSPDKRDEYMDKIYESGVGVAVNFRPIHLMKYYKEKYGYKPGDFPVSEKIGSSTISIPFYPKLKDEEISYVINSINKIVTG